MGFSDKDERRIAAAVVHIERFVPPPLDQGKFPYDGRHERDGFWAKVTASSIITAGHRQYTYTGVEQIRTATGALSPWMDYPGGRTVTMHNAREAFNTTGDVVLGNSIDHGEDAYPASDWFQPVRGNPVVWVWGEYAVDGSYVYTFEYENAEQGTGETPCE